MLPYRSKLIIQLRQHCIMGEVGGVPLQNIKLLVKAELIVIAPIPAAIH